MWWSSPNAFRTILHARYAPLAKAAEKVRAAFPLLPEGGCAEQISLRCGLDVTLHLKRAMFRLT